MKLRLFFIILVLFPLNIFASIEITEIMYDAEGTDTNHEWVEIYNTGVSLDISEWYFYEADVHHRLIPDGFAVLDSGERAVIVQNVEIMRNLLGDTVNLVKSSFSLSNTGEELAMSNNSKIIQSSAVYSIDDGANGNGNSLQKVNSDWIQAEPTPGFINSRNIVSVVDTQESESDQTVSASNNITKKSVIKEDYYTGSILQKGQALSQNPVRIMAHVAHIRNNKKINKIKGGIYHLNFGDGNFIESDERIDTNHVYEYPGKYNVVLEFHPNKYFAEFDEESYIVESQVIDVHASGLTIEDIDDRNSIVLKNNTDVDLDISYWDISHTRSGSTYEFPKHSIIYAQEIKYIPKTAHSLVGIGAGDSWIVLRNKNDISMSSYTEDTAKLNRARGNVKINSVTRKIIPQDTVVDIEAPTVSHIDSFMEQHPQKELVNFNDNKYSPEKPDLSGLPVQAIITTGVMGVILAGMRLLSRKGKEESSEGTVVIGEIELIE